MEQQIILRERQRALSGDFMDMQNGLRETFDELIRQSVGPGNYYSGFGVAGSLFELTVQPGRLYMGGAMYRRTASTVFAQELFNLRPLSQKRMIAVVGWGRDVETTGTGSATEPRQFVINTTTRETEMQQVSTRAIRQGTIDLVAGTEAAQPNVPSIGQNNVLIAVVLLNTAGIESIAMNPAALLPQAERNAVALAVLQDFLEAQVLRIDTMVSDQAAIRAQLDQLANKSSVAAVRLLAEAALERANQAHSMASNLDSEFLRDFEDHFVNERLSNVLRAGYSAIVDQGLEFPMGSSATLTNGIELFNPVDPKVKIDNDLILPAHTARLRVDTFSEGKVARQASMQAFTSSTHAITVSKPPTKRTVFKTRKMNTRFYLPNGSAHSRTLFGITFDITNVLGQARNDIPVNAQTSAWAMANVAAEVKAASAQPDFKITAISGQMQSDPNGVFVGPTPKTFRMIIYVTYTYSYQTTETIGSGTSYVQDVSTMADGQGRAETFLQERDGWLTQIGLFFSSKGASGDLKVLVTEVDQSGAPDLTQAPAVVTVPLADIKTAPVATASAAGIETIVGIPPVMLRGGRRYAIAVISNGNHFLRMTENVGQITQGEHWALSDANHWVRPVLDTPQTMAARLYFARFHSTKVEVNLKPLSLAGGIQDVSVRAQMVVPELTNLAFEVQPDGSNWRILGATSGQRIAADLSGNPELMPLRVVFEGTQDIMPALSRGSAKSVVQVSKPAAALTHFSSVIDVGAGTTANRIKVIHALRGFDPGEHSFAATLITDPNGARGTEVADAVVDTELADGTISRTSVFELPVGQRFFEIKSVGGTTGPVKDLYRIDSVYAAFFDV